MLKTILKTFFVFSLLFVMTGCSWNNKPLVKEQSNQDQSSYVYKNDDLGFSISLPRDFDHYEVQRKNLGAKTDLEFYVLTNDASIITDFKGFGKIMTIRVTDDAPDESEGFTKLGTTKKKSYSLKFWDEAPKDWEIRFNETFKNDLIKSFKAND